MLRIYILIHKLAACVAVSSAIPGHVPKSQLQGPQVVPERLR